MQMHLEPFGLLPDGRAATLFTLDDGRGLRVRLTDYGAIVVGVELSDRAGRVADVTLGFDTLAQWLHNGPYFGATIGRYANRIARGRFTLDGHTYTLATNDGRNHLHGGRQGFDQRLWTAAPEQAADRVAVRMTYRSPDGEEGYPGQLDATVVYTLTARRELRIEFSAVTDRPTVVNLAHHSYWNLAGHDSGDILGHELWLAADEYTVVDDELIPTGELRPVRGTPLDFTRPTAIGARIAQLPGGYDHNFVLREATADGQSAAPDGNPDAAVGERDRVWPAARLLDPHSGRWLEVSTDQPGVQFYSGNFLDGRLTGKGGVRYGRHAGLCLETQRFPDSPNHPQFPSAVLRPGERYRHLMVYRFGSD